MTPPKALLALGLLALSALHLSPARLRAAEGAEPSRSQTLFEESQAMYDMGLVSAKLRAARDAGKGTIDGSRAALELARLEYAQDRPDAALSILHAADGWPRDEDLEAQWLYLRAQSRILGKGYQRARDDLQSLVSNHAEHRLAPAAALALADCDAALRPDEAAAQAYEAIIEAKGPLAAQALWGLGQLREKQKQLPEALQAYEGLLAAYPFSVDAESARLKVAALNGKRLKPTPVAVKAGPKAFYVRVGLYGRRSVPRDLAKNLRRNHYKVEVKPVEVAGRAMSLVRVGPYKKRAQAESDVRRLRRQDKLDIKDEYIQEE